jgi:uncharacterized RDD family membrane protein YckC
MTSTDHQLPQPVPPGIAVTFRRVSFKDRFIARLIDLAQYWLINFIANLGFMALFALYSSDLALRGNIPGTLVAYGWFLFRDGLSGGANYGKTNREIMVIDVTTQQPCTVWQSFGRNIVSDISAVSLFVQLAGIVPLFVLYLVVLAVDIWRMTRTPDGRRVGDLIADTKVVYMDDFVSLEVAQRQIQTQTATG